VLGEVLGKEVQVLTMQAKIQSQARDEMSRTQRGILSPGADEGHPE